MRKLVIVPGILCHELKTNKKNVMDLFYGWGSTGSRLQSHYKETVYFLLLDLESRALTTRVLLHEALSLKSCIPAIWLNYMQYIYIYINCTAVYSSWKNKWLEVTYFSNKKRVKPFCNYSALQLCQDLQTFPSISNIIAKGYFH